MCDTCERVKQGQYDSNLVGRNAIQAVRFQNALEEIAGYEGPAGGIARKALAAESHLCPICDTPMNRGKIHDSKKHDVYRAKKNHPSAWRSS